MIELLISKLNTKKLPNNLLKLDKELDIDFKEELKKHLDTQLPTTILTIPQSLQTPQIEIVRIIKKEILSKNLLKEAKLTNEEIKEFKKITSLKELINFANKKELNIKKISFFQIEKKLQKDLKPKAKIQLSQIPPKKENPLKEILNQKNIKTQKSEIKKSQKQKIENNLNTKLNTKNENTLENILKHLIKKTDKVTIRNTAAKNEKINKTDLKTTTLNKKIQETQEKPFYTKNITTNMALNTKSYKVLHKKHQNIKNIIFQNTIKTNDYKNHQKNNTNYQKELDKTIQTIINQNEENNTNLQISNQTNTTEKHIKNTENIFFNHASTQQIQPSQINTQKINSTIKHFASNLKETIDNYKPPVSKLSIELHPKELGKVEVTLVQRGDNLQIQINSQPSTINFFQNTQQDLKNALINMGYSEVNMSFNSNQQQQQKQQYKQNQSIFSKEEDEFIIEIPYTYA